jgi:hypothetical protein
MPELKIIADFENATKTEFEQTVETMIKSISEKSHMTSLLYPEMWFYNGE